MSFPRSIQDEDDLLADVLAQIDADYAPNEDRLRAELDAIGNDASAVPQTPEPVKPVPVGFGFQTPDFDDPDVIREEVKLTRYDKARAKLRNLEEKRAALPADCVSAKIAIIEEQIKRAREAVKAAEGDVARMRDGIDEWRAGAGRDEYNASRRNGKGTPHADTSNMTEEQKAQHEKDMAFMRTFRSRHRAKGWTDDKVEAALIVKMRERGADRAAMVQEEADEATMRADPRHGIF